MVTFYRLGASQLIVTQIFAFVFFGFPHGHVNGYDLYEGSPCKLTDGSPGVCTIIDQCMSVYQGLVSNTLPYEEVAKNRCGFVKAKEVVCCKDSQTDPSIGRTTPRVITPTRSEFSDNVFSEKRALSGNDGWPSVRIPQVEHNIINNRNVERIQDQNSRPGLEENGGEISSRFFLGNLLSGQHREKTFQNPHVQQQPINVRCINYMPKSTTSPPVQIGPRIFGILNINKPARTTPRPSVLSPVLDALRPLKEIPLNFISSLGNRRNNVNVQGQLNINPGQATTFGDTTELCVDNNNGLIQGGTNTNHFVGSDSVNNYQNQGIWSNPSSSIPAPFLHTNQPVTSPQNSNGNPNHNIWNIPNPSQSAASMPSFSMIGNQPAIPMQNQNLNPNQNMWNIPNSHIPMPFAPSNSMNGNQHMGPFQPVPMPKPSLNENQSPNSPMSVPFTENGFRTTTVKALIENNQNWGTNEDSQEPWMVEVLRTTTVATTTSTIRAPKTDVPQLEPWMLDALKDSNSTVSNQPDNRSPKPWTVRPDTKSEPLQMPPSSEFDPWMLEVIKEDSTSTRAPTNPDRSKKDSPTITLLKKSENSTSFGDSVLDPWMKEALLADVKSTSTTTLKPQINRFHNSSNTDKKSSFEPWMLEALRETNFSSSSSDLTNIDSLRNSDIETTTKKSKFGDSVLDPWMKEALLNANESKSMQTSTLRTTESYSLEEPPIPTSRESNNGNNSFDSWMLDALQGVTSTKPTIGKVPSQRPFNDSHLESWMKETIAGEEVSSDRASDNEGAQSSKRAVDSRRDDFYYNRTTRRDPDTSKSFSSSSNASFASPYEEEWVWERKTVANNNNSSQTTTEDYVNYWINEALKQKTKPNDDKEPWDEESTNSVKPSKSPYIQHNQNSQNNHSGHGNLGVGAIIPELRNGTDSMNFDLNLNFDLNEIFDIPEIRPTKPIGPRNSRRADDACAKYRDDFGASVTYHILGGIAASLGEFPHMAALGYPSTAANRDYDWNCGASLISDQYLLTSAHCITRDGPTIARLGKVSIDTDEDGAIAADYLIDEPIKHPIYTNARQYHDIALVRLNRKVNYTENIRPACLDTNQTPMPANTNVVVTGWGTISLRTRSRSDVLLKANLTTVPLSSCNQSHADYEHNRKLPNGLTEAQMCAFDPELVKDACEGDSGGPLQIVDDTGMSTIYGVTSFGVSCASKIPGVYARVSNYVDWIESIVWP